MPILILNMPEDSANSTPFAKEFSAQGINDYEQFVALNATDLQKNSDYFEAFQSSEIEVSPKEFARFMSHRLAWQEVVNQNLGYALICENDVHLVSDAMNKAIPSIQAVHGDFGLIFINNRMTCWNNENVQNMDDIVNSVNAGKAPKEFGGKFGDGYFISQSAAQKLLTQSKEDKVFTNIDWWLLANCWNCEKANIEEVSNLIEMQNFIQATGGRKAIITGGISPQTLLYFEV